jgi:Zn-dependent protease
MRFAWRLATVAGIEIKVHATFLLIFVWVAINHGRDGVPGRGLLADVGFTLALFGCVLLHELGHALMARRFGVKTRDIILLPIGGLARLERIPEKPVREL